VDLIERIIKEGERRVAELEVCLSSGYAVTGRLKRREIHYASGSEHQGLSLRVIHEGRIGTSATSNPERWEECLDAAISSARLATPQNWKGLPGPGKFDHAPLNFDPAVIPDPGTARGLLELEALTYIRGRSIPNQYLIVDEAQNLTPHEIKTVITRVGEGTKVVLTGDATQIDNPYLDSSSNGLSYAVEQMRDLALVGHVTLVTSERSDLASLASQRL